tara:strand:- start:941 stop:1201 length:261 start_codon:yes stop_codon:yes gene_type:complete
MNLDIQIGDTILAGRFKNKRVVVKEFGRDAKGQPTINGRPMLNFRIEKLIPPKPEKLEKQAKEVNIFDGKLREYINKVIDQELNKG